MGECSVCNFKRKIIDSRKSSYNVQGAEIRHNNNSAYFTTQRVCFIREKSADAFHPAFFLSSDVYLKIAALFSS